MAHNYYTMDILKNNFSILTNFNARKLNTNTHVLGAQIYTYAPFVKKFSKINFYTRKCSNIKISLCAVIIFILSEIPAPSSIALNI